MCLGLPPPVRAGDAPDATADAHATLLPPGGPTAASAGVSVASAIQSSRLLSREAKVEQRKRDNNTSNILKPGLSSAQQCLVEVAAEKGVSSWLTALPCFENDTVLSKQDFRDAVGIRYGLQLKDVPTVCACGKDFTTDHAMTCATGGYPTCRHDNIRDVLSEALSSVCCDVQTEPRLVPLSGEEPPLRTSSRDDHGRVDIRARGFWTRQQNAFFDVTVTHPKASLLSASEVASQLQEREKRKKRMYGFRITQIEHGSFTPLVFSTTGQYGRECSIFMKSLACRIVQKNKDLR